MLLKTLGRICVAVSFALLVTFILVPPTKRDGSAARL